MGSNFGLVILGVGGVGLVINISSLVVLSRKERPSLFHHLLKVLALFDLLVVLCCSLSFGLASVLPWWLVQHQSRWLQWVMPITHIVVACSIYCTVLISLERYVRIRYLCQLRPHFLVKKSNLPIFVALLICVPTLFYLPKFFEVRHVSVSESHNVSQSFNCSLILASAPISELKLSDFHAAMLTQLVHECHSEVMADLPSDSLTNLSFVFKVNRSDLSATWLRRSPLYYHLYYVYLNLLFSSLIPLLSLVYLNLKTVRELRNIMNEAVVIPMNNMRRAVSTENLEQTEKPEEQHSFRSDGNRRRSQSTSTLNGLAVHFDNKVTMERKSNESDVNRMEAVDVEDFSKCERRVLRRSTLVTMVELDELRVARRQSRPQPMTTSTTTAVTTRSNAVVAVQAEDGGQERRLTRISIAIVWLFLGCHVWKLIPTLYEASTDSNGADLEHNWPESIRMFENVSHLLITLNSAINFLIYLVL